MTRCFGLLIRGFLTLFRPDVPDTTKFNVKLLDGGANTQLRSDAGFEAGLDIEYTVGLATNVPTTFISVGPGSLATGEVEGFLDEINALIVDPKRPNFLSTSYGFGEDDIILPVAQGDTAKVSATHTHSSAPWAHQSSLRLAMEASSQQTLSALRATSLHRRDSPTTSRPQSTYQKADVDSYIASLKGQYDGLFNTSGRGFPDVAAKSVNFEIIPTSHVTLLSGTSASTPVFASVIALLNDELISAGKSPLGFLNPFLYGAAGRAR
ncbi:peptidase S8/S53 domain-containing protein [Mycena pura]|uniref:Peptidase S8/S53 domain-containing protein n=1 Tax=Mycena pura TaxID=153505 RepID=A0AAD6V4H6_9AGAR|nr:peptidase S8/S53 domain-containing protein [Mycena pura]